ncbi:MAG: TetR/AcrR family transcriptional regulator [Planctomycetaceae bacterium]|nr:TetR/AcrR family transcriptional regulator [Planctomycetales bacterium]MCB9939135.1 TetR/AcrR family transcriptional regulator [Planctomycetaceae bacterium]
MKEKILDAAEKMVQDRGLNAVSFQDLANAVELRKASIFHHFPNKEALARALIERCGSKHRPEYAAVVDSNASAPEKLRGLAGIFEKGLRNQRPCLLAALGSGVNTLSEVAVQELGEMARGAVSRFALVFQQGRDEGTLQFSGEPIDAATGFFAMLQGLQVLVRASGDTSAFSSAANAYVDSISLA